jgi:membrane-associated phospholipid phosphatase
MRHARNWLVSFLLTVVAVLASYAWLDRPIALFAHAQMRHFDLFEKVTRIPELMTPLLIIAFVVLGLRAFTGRPMSRLQTAVVLACVSVAVTSAIKDQLKFAFGRTWPETWVRNNPSFIRDGVYGFNPFHGGPGFAAFPSGHTAAVCAVMSVLWICYPKYRAAYAICIAAVAVGLMGANFHFLGDIIAGAFLGTLIGWLTVVLWGLGHRPMRPTPPPEGSEAEGGPAQYQRAGTHSARPSAL